MLVHPVRARRRRSTRSRHHGCGGDLLAPRQRRVPVVAQVVVVEQHPGRHGREQPAHRRRRPRLVVQPRVLLEVLDLLDDVRIALPVRLAQASQDLVRRVVGVHLVTEQQQDVGPLVVRAGDHPPGERDERVGAELVEVRRVERRRAPAAAERQPVRRVGIRRADHARREPADLGSGHTSCAVELDLVRRRRLRRQVLEPDQRVVVAVDPPRRRRCRRPAATHLDLARPIGLDTRSSPGARRRTAAAGPTSS